MTGFIIMWDSLKKKNYHLVVTLYDKENYLAIPWWFCQVCYIVRNQ